jgi:FKBP-type peptidyl-prolyl cis-trans isomerase
MRRPILPLLLSLSVLGGCLSNGVTTSTVPCDAALLSLGAVSGDTTTLAGGLKVLNLRTGTGATAVNGNVVQTHYTGYLSTGSRFDSSCVSGVPIQFQLGAGSVIKGFDQGLAGMRVGGMRRLVIPPSLGYGDQANGPIPGGSTLIFDIELLAAN